MFDRLFIFLLVAICYTSLKNVRLEYYEQCFACNFTIVYKPRKLKSLYTNIECCDASIE